MNFQTISAAFKKPLPGRAAQYKMAPAFRPDYDSIDFEKCKPNHAAVLLVFFEKDTELHLVFTKRKQNLAAHSGQMSFPGGKVDEDDHSYIHAALREAHEEIGIDLKNVEVVGELSDLYIPPSNFLVYPFIAVYDKQTPFLKQESEVEEIIEIPLRSFMSGELATKIKISFGGTLVEVPAYVYKEYVIWGATAIMLSEMIELLKD